MRRYGLIGFPLSHSFSKAYFAKKFEAENIGNCSYENFSIPSIGEFPPLLINNPDLKGINVTIPYKEQVLPYLHEKNEVVAKTGACNCIKITDGKLKGFNTDVIGFEKSLQQYLQPHHRKAIILGTGGASKAVAYVLDRLGISFFYVSRTANTSHEFLNYENLSDDILSSHQLIINTTPLGMFPEIESFPAIKYELLTPGHYLFDLVYNPDLTVFLQKGKERGAVTKNGYDMLVLQAEESWRIWNDE